MERTMSVADFYEKLAPFYHLLFEDWEASMERQGRALDGLIRACGGAHFRKVLDVSCGIGTQSLALARRGYAVTASDIASEAVERAKREAKLRGLSINFSVVDMRSAYDYHKRQFDVVLSADNSVPHMLSDQEILRAFRQLFACTRPGGLCIISVRDYGALEQGGVQIKPYGIRTVGKMRWLLFQVWEWRKPFYDFSLYLAEDEGGVKCRTRVMRATYYAVTIRALMRLMAQAGFQQVQRFDDVFVQPVIIGSRSEVG